MTSEPARVGPHSLPEFAPHQEQYGDKCGDGDIETRNTHAALLIDMHCRRHVRWRALFKASGSLGSEFFSVSTILLLVMSRD